MEIFMQCSGVIVAAGSGRRMGRDQNKQWILLGGVPMLARTLAVFEACPVVEEIVLVAAQTELEQAKRLVQEFQISKVACVTPGGKSRQESVYQGLCRAKGDIVLIHDGARPFVTVGEIEAVYQETLIWGAAAAGTPVKDTIKQVNSQGLVTDTPPRALLWAAATPQGFSRSRLLSLHEQAVGSEATDDSMLAEQAGDRVKMVQCGEQNIKITTPEDLKLAELFLKNET